MPAGCHAVSESVALPVTRSGFRRLCFLHRLLLSLPDGLPAGWPKSSTPPKAVLHNKGGSNAAHGFDEGLVTPTERIRAGQVGFEPRWEREHNVKLEREKKSVRKGQTAVPRVHTFKHISQTSTARFSAILYYSHCSILY